MPETLQPGCHIDSHWGHYQSPRTVDLALNLGWIPTGYTIEEVTKRVEAYNEGEVPPYEETLEDASEHMHWLHEQAEEWINDNCVPEGHWFGHHPDLGDMGVWLLDEHCDQCHHASEYHEDTAEAPCMVEDCKCETLSMEV